MKLEGIKEKILAFVTNQLPFIAKILKIKPSADKRAEDIDFDPDEEMDEEFLASEEDVLEELQENSLDEDELEENEDVENQALSKKDQIILAIKDKFSFLTKKKENLKDESLEEDFEGEDLEDGEKLESEEDERTRKRKKYFSLGIRVLALIVILYMIVDEFILKKDQVNPSGNTPIAQNEEIITPTPVSETPLSETTNEESQADLSDSGFQDGSQDQGVIDEPSFSDNETSLDETNFNQDTSFNEPQAETPSDNLNSDMQNSDMNESIKEPINDSGFEVTDFNNEGYTAPDEKNKADEALFKDQGFEDISKSELAREIEENKTQEEIENSPEDEEIDGINIGVLRELEEKLREKEGQLDQAFLGEDVDARLKGIKTPIVDYLRVGRGLVFNCIGGHWACVDEYAYNLCRDASKINKSNQRKATCKPFEVYATDKDCERAQYEAMLDPDKENSLCD